VISLSAFLYLEVFAAAALAAWVFARRPNLGPTALPSALALMLGTIVVMDAFPSVVRVLPTLPGGRLTLLCLAMLPPAALFLTTAWVIRVLMAQAGPRDGHRVRPSSAKAPGPAH
jgi:hypothetical protein